MARRSTRRSFPLGDCLGCTSRPTGRLPICVVASVGESDRVCFGEPPNDAIWVPRILNTPSPPVAAAVKVRGGPREIADKHRRTTGGPQVMLCPACNQKEFKRWPWGWDGHAAHTCLDSVPRILKSEKRSFVGVLQVISSAERHHARTLALGSSRVCYMNPCPCMYQLN